MNQSTTSSDIENEANLLLNGEMDPSNSMTHFLDGGNNPDIDYISENSPSLPTEVQYVQIVQPAEFGFQFGIGFAAGCATFAVFVCVAALLVEKLSK